MFAIWIIENIEPRSTFSLQNSSQSSLHSSSPQGSITPKVDQPKIIVTLVTLVIEPPLIFFFKAKETLLIELDALFFLLENWHVKIGTNTKLAHEDQNNVVGAMPTKICITKQPT